MTDLERLDKIFTLTPLLKRHVDSLLWLFSEQHRREGRTYLLMYVFMRLAIESYGQSIPSQDHYPFSARIHARKLFIDPLLHLLEKDLGLSKRVIIANTHIDVAITVNEERCTHCSKNRAVHGPQGKCLFEATTFQGEDNVGAPPDDS